MQEAGLLRLTGAVESPGTTYAYAYDLAGNRTDVWENGVQTQSQSYNAANQVIGWSYDAVGNLLSDGTHTSAYDALSRQVSRDGMVYQYNGDGVLVQAGATTYTLDLAAPLSQVLHDGSASYVYGNSAERLRAVGGAWYIPDALGSVRATLDDSGTLLASTSYDPWGLPQAGAIAPFGFTGEVQDAAGMVYLRARWYDAGSGRFGGRDPFAGFPEVPYSLNPYQYAYAAPTVYTDPSGNVVQTCPTGYRPRYEDGEFRSCEEDPDFPEWLGFLKGTMILPGPVGATGTLGGRLLPMPPLPQLGREGMRAGAEACINLLGGLGVLLGSSTIAQEGVQPRDRNKGKMIVVELGWGGRFDNLIALSVRFPNAKIYGVDNFASAPLPGVRSRIGLNANIEFIQADYTQYAGSLKNKADVVVSVAPQPATSIEIGVERFIKKGGMVDLLVGRDTAADRQLGNQLAGRYGTKPLFEDIIRHPKSAQASIFGGDTIDSKLGVYFSSLHFGHGAREIYVGAWN